MNKVIDKKNKENGEVKPVKKLEWKEVRENLVAQRQEALLKIDELTKLALKAEGAIEVGDQMNKEEVDES
tara:strand:- start:1286 stop:1495 length:210 start_codon:yes stop_codon:yes gene_type:complete